MESIPDVAGPESATGIDLQCPECGAAVLWKELQILSHCEYCASLLHFQPELNQRFLIEPRIKSREDLKQVLVQSRAEKKRAEVMGRYPTGNDEDQPQMLTMFTEPLGPYLAEMDAKIRIERASMLYAPYWHFLATLYQSVLAVNSHGTKEYYFRRAPVDQTLPAYSSGWNFRDKGLRIRDARLKQATSESLSAIPHIPFTTDLKSMFDAVLRAHQPVGGQTDYIFKFHALCHHHRFAVFRPYWIVEFQCEGTEVVIVDASFGTVAGYPAAMEAQKLFTYNERPYANEKPAGIKILSSRCPVCGIDIRWHPATAIHFCHNCGRGLVLRAGEIQVQNYDYMAPPNKAMIYLPFWKFRMQLTHKEKEYSNLGDFYRLFFNDRQLKNRQYSDSLWIPAIRIPSMAKGDLLLASLIAQTPPEESELLSGPIQPPDGISHAQLDAGAAAEMLGSAVPTASGVLSTLLKSGILVAMLKQTQVRFDRVRLILIPFPIEGENLVVGTRRFSLSLLEPAYS